MSQVPPNPLFELHRQAEAEFQNWENVQIVQTFGQPQAEYAVLRKSTALMDLPQRGILELTGKDRLTFLNNLLTNQTYDKTQKKGLSVGQGVYAFLLDPKTGRIIADMNVIERESSTLLEMDVRVVDLVAKVLENYHFAEQVAIASRVGQLHEMALHGPGAMELVRDELRVSGIESLKPQESVNSGDLIVWRDDPCGVPGYYIVQTPEAAKARWVDLLARLGPKPDFAKSTIRPIGWAAFNSARIEAGRALFGIDFDHTALPAETSQLGRAVSFTKGCYPGQEIVARMHARGQVAKRIAGIRMDDPVLPIAGAEIFDSQSSQIGAITSSTISPILSGIAVGLGILKRPHFEVGTKLQIPAEGALHGATVVELPFLGAKQ
ncbi:MAG TPA: glycine cleavage T C-terminal barrel domain-containing protein [Tepidisphaeraceae bacterium]|nr:glycine cleavage T C-terminal barrel domain-containing protein [Tepidisphaeraceae bacterium]